MGEQMRLVIACLLFLHLVEMHDIDKLKSKVADLQSKLICVQHK